MELKIPGNSKFACIALNNCSLAEELLLPIKLEEHTWIVGESPFPLEDHWKEQLGTIGTEEILGSYLFLVCFCPSKNPGVLNDENQILTEKILSIFYTLFLNGIPYYDRGILLNGGFLSKYVEIRQITYLNWHPEPNPLATPISLEKESFLFALKAGKTLIKINSEEDEFIRVKKGFNAWKSGIGDSHQYGEARLHQFVRAAEAFLKLKEGRAKKDFIHRGNLLSENNPMTAEVLEEIFNLRSCAEHMNDFNEVLEIYPENEREEKGKLRTLQAELLASHIYKKLLTDPSFLRIAESDKSLETFWNKKDHEILQLHNERINLFPVI